MSLLKDRSFIATGLAHLVVDMLNSQRALLLAVYSVPLGLTNAIIGLVNAISVLIGSLSQPLFGWLADRFGARWVAAGGILWMAVTFGIAVSVPGYASLYVLVLAALGSGAFHPAGTMQATLRGRQLSSGRETTAASIFFLFGQGGLSFGPAIAGPILDRWGPSGLLLILLFVIPVGLNVAYHIEPAVGIETDDFAETPQAGSPHVAQFIPFLLLTGFRSWTQSNMTTFLPKYLSDLNYRPSFYGLITALFMGGSAVGIVLGGWLADRYGMRKVTLWTLAIAVLPLTLFPYLSTSSWVYLIVPLAGALTGAPHSILVVIAQRMLPRKMGMASGLVLGFTFISGALGTLLSGIQADSVGFGSMFLTTAGITLLAAMMTLQLQEI